MISELCSCTPEKITLPYDGDVEIIKVGGSEFKNRKVPVNYEIYPAYYQARDKLELFLRVRGKRLVNLSTKSSVVDWVTKHKANPVRTRREKFKGWPSNAHNKGADIWNYMDDEEYVLYSLQSSNDLVVNCMYFSNNEKLPASVWTANLAEDDDYVELKLMLLVPNGSTSKQYKYINKEFNITKTLKPRELIANTFTKISNLGESSILAKPMVLKGVHSVDYVAKNK